MTRTLVNIKSVVEINIYFYMEIIFITFYWVTFNLLALLSQEFLNINLIFRKLWTMKVINNFRDKGWGNVEGAEFKLFN